MSKRNQAVAEARFLRGETGVDGNAASEETRDPAEVEQDQAREQLLRGRTYLGREFLTWLLHRTESGDALLEHGELPVVALALGRVTLRGVHGEVTELNAKGTLAPYSSLVKRALAQGLLVHAVRLRITHGERTFECTVDAEYLDIKSAKLPELLTEEEDDRAAERLDLVDTLSEILEALVDSFLEVRGTKAWASKTVPALKAWMEGDAAEKTTVMSKAGRARGVRPEA